MQFITRNNRNQTFFNSLKENLNIDNAVRLIDFFIDTPDLAKLSFTKTIHKNEGRDFTYSCTKNCFDVPRPKAGLLKQ